MIYLFGFSIIANIFIIVVCFCSGGNIFKKSIIKRISFIIYFVMHSLNIYFVFLQPEYGIVFLWNVFLIILLWLQLFDPVG